MLLQSHHHEGVPVATKGDLVETISTAVNNEIYRGRKKDANNNTFDLSLRSGF